MTLQRILVPTDFGPASSAALDIARDLARLAGARLYLLHVVDDVAARFIDFPYAEIEEAQKGLEAAAQQQLETLTHRPDLEGLCEGPVVITSTSPASAITGFGLDEQIDVIVMGTHGHGPMMRMFLGAVADRVVRSAPCPVMTVREPRRRRGDVAVAAERDTAGTRT